MRRSLNEVEAAIRASWGPDTCYDPDLWNPDMPERAQCGTTAMVIQDLLGGDLLEAKVYRDGEQVEHHYWTRLPSGIEIALTAEQFDDDLVIGEPLVRVRDGQKPKHRAQYEALAQRVRERLDVAAHPPTVAGT